MADTFYLWSPMRNGGKFEMVPNSLGGERRVVTERNILPVGSKVSQSELKASDEQWQEWIDGGVVRNYPYPEMPAGSSDSPVDFLTAQLTGAASSEEERMVAAMQAATLPTEEVYRTTEEAKKAAQKQ